MCVLEEAAATEEIYINSQCVQAPASPGTHFIPRFCAAVSPPSALISPPPLCMDSPLSALFISLVITRLKLHFDARLSLHH